MLPVQYFQLLIKYWFTMAIIFENVQTKNTKEFVFKVLAHNDGTYTVSSVSYRIYPDSSRRETSRKEWTAHDLQELRAGEFMRSRQGRLFADSQFWHVGGVES